MFYSLASPARELLANLIEHKTECAKYYNDFYFSLPDIEKRRYDKIAEHLADCGYVTLFDINNAKLIRDITLIGEEYFNLENEHRNNQLIQGNTINDSNIIIQLGHNNVATIKSNDELSKLIEQLSVLTSQNNELSLEEKCSIMEYAEVIQEESQKDKPKKSLISTAVAGLKNILPKLANAMELAAAIATLIQFAMVVA